MEKRVHSHFLNLRPAPNTVQAPIGKLHAGQLMKVIAKPNATWSEVEVTVGGQKVRGFVADMYLRDPINAKADGLIELAGQEFRRMEWGVWKDSDAKPTDPGYKKACPRVKDYWTEMNDARDCSVAWSAAFISFVVKKANLGLKFKYASSHATYLADSKKGLQANDATKAYWCHPLDSHAVRVGDLIGAWRSGTGCPAGPFTYEDIGEQFCSHCDLVVAVRGGVAIALGGNVSNTVKQTEYALDTAGKVQPISKRIALMRRRF